MDSILLCFFAPLDGSSKHTPRPRMKHNLRGPGHAEKPCFVAPRVHPWRPASSNVNRGSSSSFGAFSAVRDGACPKAEANMSNSGSMKMHISMLDFMMCCLFSSESCL
eukprot:Skav235319  [mRNA]  locus=scaffold520:484706:487952:- [translate_table: standard]